MCQRKAVMSAFLAVNGGAKANIAGDENRKLSWLQARNRRTCSHEKVYRPPPRQGSATPAGNPDFKGWIRAVVEVDPEDLSDTVERVNITLPKRVHEGGQICGGAWGNAFLVFGACGARDDGTGSRERVRPPSLPGKSRAVAPAIVQARSASLTLRHR